MNKLINANTNFSAISKLFPDFASTLAGMSTYWNHILDDILKHIQNSDQDSNIMPHDFWKHLFSKFRPYHLNHDEKMEFIQLIEKLIKTNFRLQKVKNEVQFCGQSGARFHKLQNSLHFKHKQSLDYFKFMAIKIFHDHLKNEFCFTDLKFDLSVDQTYKVAAKVRQFCSNDMTAFAFLSLYLQISVKNRLFKDEFAKVEQDYLNQLESLAKKYPPNSFEIEFQNNGFKLQKVKSHQILEKYFFENSGAVHFNELKNFIIKKAEQTKKDKKTFENLVKQICYAKGYSFKSGVKIKSPQNQTSIFRTIEKLIDDLLESKQNYFHHPEQRSGNQTVLKEANKCQKRIKSVEDLNKMIEDEKQKSLNKIKKILEQQRIIVFGCKDLIRGKCTFSTVQDVIETVNILQNHIQKEGHIILEVKDRLRKHTKDAVIIIQLPNSIAELQLVVKLDSLANQFNHKIYQLKRSKLYTPITNLFVQNQVWCENFFTQLFDLFDQVNKIHKNFDFEEGIKFRDLKYDLNDFKSKFLNPFGLNYKQDENSKRQEQTHIEQSAQPLIEILTQKNYQNVNKSSRIQEQKINQVQFYKQNIDYEKGMQLLFFIQANINQPDLQVLKLKGDIMLEKGMLEQALNCYLNCVNLYENGSKSENDTLIKASILYQIGLVYYSKGKYAENLQYYENCLQLKKQIKGQESSADTAATLNNTGGIYQKQSNYVKALESYLMCLQIKQKKFGKQSIQVAMTLNNIGSAYDAR